MSNVISADHITTPSGTGGLSSWTRAHVDSPAITWSTRPGPGGTLVIQHLDRPRNTLPPAKEAAL